MALLLNRSDVQQVLTMAKAIDVVESAFGELANATAEMPPRTVMIDPAVGGWIAYMPAYLKTGGALGAKAVTVYKDNPSKFNLPTTIGTILVQNNETGEVVAAMDGGYLTAVRTGAVSGVATRHMARPDAKIGGVLGAGVQARQQAVAIAEASNIETILTFSLDDDASRQEFADWVADQNWSRNATRRKRRIALQRIRHRSPRHNRRKPHRQCRLVETRRTHQRYRFSRPRRPRARHRNHPTHPHHLRSTRSMQSRSRRPPNPRRRRRLLVGPDIAGNLGDVVNGDTPGRTSNDEVTLFKSVGLAIQDISCAALVYREAVATASGRSSTFRRDFPLSVGVIRE